MRDLRGERADSSIIWHGRIDSEDTELMFWQQSLQGVVYTQWKSTWWSPNGRIYSKSLYGGAYTV